MLKIVDNAMEHLTNTNQHMDTYTFYAKFEIYRSYMLHCVK